MKSIRVYWRGIDANQVIFTTFDELYDFLADNAVSGIEYIVEMFE